MFAIFHAKSPKSMGGWVHKFGSIVSKNFLKASLLAECSLFTLFTVHSVLLAFSFQFKLNWTDTCYLDQQYFNLFCCNQMFQILTTDDTSPLLTHWLRISSHFCPVLFISFQRFHEQCQHFVIFSHKHFVGYCQKACFVNVRYVDS